MEGLHLALLRNTRPNNQDATSGETQETTETTSSIKRSRGGFRGRGRGKRADGNNTPESSGSKRSARVDWSRASTSTNNTSRPSLAPRPFKLPVFRSLNPEAGPRSRRPPPPPISDTSKEAQGVPPLRFPIRGTTTTPPPQTTSSDTPQTKTPDTNTSKYVDAPADDRDDIIEALVWELEHEKHLKTKARWDINDDYLAELDSFAPETLFETFHVPIQAISTKFFPPNISWQVLSTRISTRTENLTKSKKYFPPFIKLPCASETWLEVVNHPNMTCALFLEGVISNTLANKMCHCPALQAEGDLASHLDTFYYHCMSLGPGTRDAAEWMALTLQMMHKMVYPDRSNPRYMYQAEIPEIKPIEESTHTKDIISALVETVKILREAVNMPLPPSESDELKEMVTELVVANFRLSVEWHKKPLAFKQQGPMWHLRTPVRDDGEFMDIKDESIFINPEGLDKSGLNHVIAVITPTLLREEWDKTENRWWQGKIWVQPKLLVAQGPPAPM
ncbi:hypothetical protein TWF694_000200 [Orbilia ellipsospora]